MSKKRRYWANSRLFTTILKVVWILVLILTILAVIKTCAECSYRAHIVDKTGYLPDYDDWDNIPDVLPPYDENDTLNEYDKVMLEQFFPPIGNQGDKGTCVAWAVGYNLKTALNAIENHWDSTMLAKPENQTSPKDLWLSIPPRQKGAGCSGAGFESTFNVLLSVGAASMETVPYQDLGNCNGVGIGDTINKIHNYYQITRNGQLPTINQMKAYIADTIPLVIGARLGDRFMRWSDDGVINHDTYNYTGMHAYHAMVIVGYDDSRHAFRLRNSWGPEWGDKGSIWVDYDFFYHEMCYAVLMAENKENNNNQNSQ